MTTAGGEVAYLELSDPAFSIRSEPVLRAREENWYARTSYGIAVLRYDEVGKLLKDRRLGQGSRRWPEHNGVEGRFADWWHRSLINLVGEDHARQRRVLNPAFSPRLIDTKVPVFQALANELIDAFADRGRCEFVAELASRTPPASSASWSASATTAGSSSRSGRRRWASPSA